MAIRSPHQQTALQALDIVAHEGVLPYLVFAHPHGYALLSGALCANRTHWSPAVRERPVPRVLV